MRTRQERVASPEKTDSKTPEPEPKSTVLSTEDWVKEFETVFPKGGIYKGKGIEPDEASEKEEKVVPETEYKVKGKDRSPSPLTPKMEIFYGDPFRDSTWSAFLAKFERPATRKEWSVTRKLNMLFDCLSVTALEFANTFAGKDRYDTLIKEMSQCFDLKDTPIAYRIMGYFRVAKFSRFCLKNMGISFRGF